MVIAVDFDGTIVEHKYPAIGKERPFAVATLKQLMDDGHKLVLWSVRTGALLDEAVAWCEERGVRFYAVNSNFDEDANSINSDNFCRKLKVQMFIDDRNVGGLPDWGSIYQMITRGISYEQLLRAERNMPAEKPKRKGWWPF